MTTCSIASGMCRMIDTLRLATTLDAEAIAQLVNNAYRPTSGASGWTHESDFVSGSRTTTAQVVELMSKPDSVVIVGFKKAVLVACVHVEKYSNTSHLGMLAVSPDTQGAGVGKQILAHAEQYASTHFNAQKFILVVVSARHELIAFYLRRGYQKTGAVMDYPLSAGAGTPKNADLKIEILERSVG